MPKPPGSYHAPKGAFYGCSLLALPAAESGDAVETLLRFFGVRADALASLFIAAAVFVAFFHYLSRADRCDCERRIRRFGGDPKSIRHLIGCPYREV